MNIKTNRLLITKFNRSMAHDVHKNSLDNDTREFLPDEVFESIEIADHAIAYLINCYNALDLPQVYPILLKSGENIGYVQAAPVGDEWEIGYHIAKKYTKKGYATEAVTAFLPVIMQYLKINEIYGICHHQNMASCKVLEKCNFILTFQGISNYQGNIKKIRKYKYTLPN